MATPTAAARLRKTFVSHPSDTSSSESLVDLDEEQQERMIASLAAADAQKTKNYKLAFVSLPVLSTILYIPRLLRPSSGTELLLAVMAMTSLASSAWILWVVPLPGEEEKESEVRVPGLGAIKRDGRVVGPVRKYIGYLNLVLCGVLALAGERVMEGKERPDELVWWMLPGGEFLKPSFIGVLKTFNLRLADIHCSCVRHCILRPHPVTTHQYERA